MTFGIRDSTLGEDGVEVGRKDHDTKKDLIGDFDGDVGKQEGGPTVGF